MTSPMCFQGTRELKDFLRFLKREASHSLMLSGFKDELWHPQQRGGEPESGPPVLDITTGQWLHQMKSLNHPWNTPLLIMPLSASLFIYLFIYLLTLFVLLWCTSRVQVFFWVFLDNKVLYEFQRLGQVCARSGPQLLSTSTAYWPVVPACFRHMWCHWSQLNRLMGIPMCVFRIQISQNWFSAWCTNKSQEKKCRKCYMSTSPASRQWRRHSQSAYIIKIAYDCSHYLLHFHDGNHTLLYLWLVGSWNQLWWIHESKCYIVE